VDIALEQRDRFKSKIVAEFPFAAPTRAGDIDENSDLEEINTQKASQNPDPGANE